MPSSICWPLGLISHFWGDISPRSLNTSSRLAIENRPRRLTQGPRLVDTVTSGDVVTMRSASGPPCLAISSRMRPNPVCVETGPFASGILISGTATLSADNRRRPRAANGTFLRKPSISAAGNVSPASRSHSSPWLIFWRARNSCICVLVIRPEWLSLCPANGSPKPFTV